MASKLKSNSSLPYSTIAAEFLQISTFSQLGTTTPPQTSSSGQSTPAALFYLALLCSFPAAPVDSNWSIFLRIASVNKIGLALNSVGNLVMGNKAIEEDMMPGWLNRFIEKTFFDKCTTHDDLQKNDMNRYCITCDASTCKFCITSGNHEGHELLTIYRHVYQDVVPLCEMESHIDCDKIQPYKCNKKWVISLTPLPHNGSGLLIEGNGACIICKRKLTDPDRFRFCSIACKYESITGKHESRGHGGTNTSHRMNAEVEVEQQVSRKRNRKGVPHKAPFF